MFYFAFFLFLCILGVSINLGKLIAEANLSFNEIANLSVAVFIFFSVIAVFLGFVFGIITNLSGVIQRPSTLVARIIITIEHPFKKKSGFSSTEIEHLKATGEVEQSSADWKSGFLSLAFLWFLLDNIEIFSNQMNILISYSETFGSYDSFTFEAFGWSVFWLMVSLASALIANVFYQLIYDYLGNEPVNRSILKACIDAQALLQAYNLEKKPSLGIRDKQVIASNYGYVYIPSNKEVQYRYRAKFAAKEENGQNYLLLVSSKPIVKISKGTNRKKKWFNSQERKND